jgi:hypothetical protein
MGGQEAPRTFFLFGAVLLVIGMGLRESGRPHWSWFFIAAGALAFLLVLNSCVTYWGTACPRCNQKCRAWPWSR